MLPLVNDAYLTLKPYVPGKPVAETERELGIRGVVKLASNENPYGPSPKAVAAVQAALAGLHDYPDGGAYYLKQALAAKYHLGEGQLIVGNGTNELLEILIRTCLRPGENVVYANPSFIVYKLVPLAMGAEVIDVPLTSELRFDLPAMARAIDARTKIAFIGNPNNPTGTYVTKKELEGFFASIPEDVIVVLDEAYFEYVSASDYPDGLSYLGERPRLLVLRTFSKAYGLAGLRVGWGAGHPELIDYLNRGRQPFNTSSLAQVGAIAALGDDEHVRKSVERTRAELQRLVPALRALRLTVYDSQANFVLVDFGRDAQVLFEQLLHQGVIVRPMGPYGLRNAARITVGTAQQNDKLLSALGRVLG